VKLQAGKQLQSRNRRMRVLVVVLLHLEALNASLRANWQR